MSECNSRSIAIYLPDLSGGGTERLHLGLAPLFVNAGYEVTLLLDQLRGDLIGAIPETVKVEVLGANRQLAALPRLLKFLNRIKPDILITNMEHMSVVAICARLLSSSRTRIVVCQHNTLSEQAKRNDLRFRLLPQMFRFLLPRADAIVAVSAGVADDLTKSCGVSRDRISVIHNGVIGSDFETRSKGRVLDYWSEAPDQKSIIAVGRMVPQKDYANLLQAFAIASKRADLRLLILGDGPERAKLLALRDALGLRLKVQMPGFLENPLPYIANADLLVLASRFEGFGLVLAESLACGTPVVSTDCPSGPAEILERGRFGRLVPVGDAPALAEAILSALESNVDREALIQRGREFSTDRCARHYLNLFDRLLRRTESRHQNTIRSASSL